MLQRSSIERVKHVPQKWEPVLRIRTCLNKTGGSLRDVAGLAALAFAMAAVSVWAAPGVPGYFGAGLALIVLAIAAIDARWFIIPNELSALGFGLALVNAAVLAPHAVMEAVGMAALRAAVLALLFLALRIGYRRVRGRDGIGLGDVKLAGVMGAWLGWVTIPIAVEIAALSAIAAYLLRHYSAGRLNPALKFPFGLFLAPSIWLCWLLEVTVLNPGAPPL
jgi:leader peptidase (prepilin peptidase) / N-methyltransferase